MHVVPCAHSRVKQRPDLPQMRAHMRKTLLAIFLIPGFLMAQDTVAPTVDEKVGPLRGGISGDYNIVQSWEFGYRFAALGGNQDKYRSDVNYRDGFRLLNSNL